MKQLDMPPLIERAQSGTAKCDAPRRLFLLPLLSFVFTSALAGSPDRGGMPMMWRKQDGDISLR
jgi:hypothetical protein